MEDDATLTLNRNHILDFNPEELTKIIETRHSIRDFSEEPIDTNCVKEAIIAANRCPSACNRQSTRVHIVSTVLGKKELENTLDGVGGFADKCSAYLLVTGNISAFEFAENNQWIVNAGIFVGYLVLTLHARGIASCVIQRPLVRNKKIKKTRELFGIKENEEVICILGIGRYPAEFRVPVSQRFSSDNLVVEH